MKRYDVIILFPQNLVEFVKKALKEADLLLKIEQFKKAISSPGYLVSSLTSGRRYGHDGVVGTCVAFLMNSCRLTYL